MGRSGAVTALVIGAGSAAALLRPVDHDVAWQLYASEQMTRGARLYIDLVEYNLPCIYYLGIPVVWISDLLGTSAIMTFKVLLLAGILASLWLCCRALPVPSKPGLEIERSVLVPILAFMLFVAPGGNFGQREHLMMVLCLPYMLATAPGVRCPPPGSRVSFLIGVLASAGFMLKPHFLVLWLVTEAHCRCVRSNREANADPRSRGFLLGMLVLGIWLMADLGAYLPIARMAWSTLGAYDIPVSRLLLRPVPLLIAISLFLALALRRRVRSRSLFDHLLLIAAGGFLIGLVQRKGWAYHFYPALVPAGVLLFVVVAAGERAHMSSAIWRARAVILAVLVATVARTMESALERKRYAGGLLAGLASTVRAHANGQAILVLSSSMFPSFPLVNRAQAVWALRFPFLWPLPGAYREATGTPNAKIKYHVGSEMGAAERWVLDCVIEDLELKRPSLVIVDESPQKQGFGGREFDYLEYFTLNHRFELLWADYVPLQRIGDHAVYARDHRGYRALATDTAASVEHSRDEPDHNSTEKPNTILRRR